MTLYKNLGHNSSVVAYSYDATSITVKFQQPNNSGKLIYHYTNNSAGPRNIEEMKQLADAGIGLNSYIMAYVKKLYEESW